MEESTLRGATLATGREGLPEAQYRVEELALDAQLRHRQQQTGRSGRQRIQPVKKTAGQAPR